MNNTIRFTIPGEPEGKGRARSTSKGVTYTPAKTRNHEAFIKMLALQAMGVKETIKGNCCAEIHIFYSMPKSTSKKNIVLMRRLLLRPTKKPDIDNVIKSIFDACNGIVFDDDKQVVELHVYKYYGEDAHTCVAITEMHGGTLNDTDG